MTDFRRIPSIEQLLARPALGRAVAQHGRYVVTQAARYAANELRDELAKGSAQTGSEIDAAEWLESRTLALARAHATPSLHRVINATGVIVHTNLGRAPLAREAAESAARIASAYSNLEYELEEGRRGQRHIHAERLLCSLTGAQAALVVNNAAAAALLTLAALANGREVIVSRGELVEIGGGFRVPEILAQSGAVLREVGTTNRTRISDYAAAINDRTALILRVHPSNFQIQGFTERPALADLAALGRKFSLPVVEDLGSGWLGLGAPPDALANEPSVRDSLAAGVDLVFFSGDKLLGGPQAGILVGRRRARQPARDASAHAGASRGQVHLCGARGDARALGRGTVTEPNPDRQDVDDDRGRDRNARARNHRGGLGARRSGVFGRRRNVDGWRRQCQRIRAADKVTDGFPPRSVRGRGREPAATRRHADCQQSSTRPGRARPADRGARR